MNRNTLGCGGWCEEEEEEEEESYTFDPYLCSANLTRSQNVW
jgi:hypothetical protein